MDIKKRLIISNTITVLIPIIIACFTIFIFILVSSDIFHTDMNYQNFKKTAAIKSELLNSIKNISQLNPENIEDPEFQKYMHHKLSSINGELIITKDNKVIFSSKDVNKIDIERCLEESKSKLFSKPIQIDNTFYMTEVSPVVFKDKSVGNVLLLAPTGKEADTFKTFIITVLIVFFASFAAVNIFMSYLYSKRILEPISILKKATAEISKGDLDFEIVENGDCEIRELCADFERMRIQLKDSVRMKMKYDDNRKMLVSSISHDLKTPITSIKGYVEGILDGIANTPEKTELYLKTIYSKAEQMDAMIDDLLLYSRLDLNKLPFNFEKTDIINYFDYCILECAPELQKSNIEISLENNLKESKYVKIDRERMRRVIVNIIDNSRKYMDKKQGKIAIILRETASSIIIEIRDNGVGINKNDINKVFDRFYRADLARSETKGSGLGLAIAKQIVEGHKGKIWAVGHEDKGTSIIVSLAKIS
ncbi:HAMP domain-containing histidine kinase [Clostridiaceae bacterium UIB06]|uniref:histidine kinase n=1 Tax=Clostridium thailandense TaxID=2794346 RepID=A0A949TLU9_9CLOT|nr:HAMP domain-containing sensor histidine kinase [Clostridium thailandense]MBV7271677.1 HAMP domain-containing histidine kinase [Clostridium thailandense]MCH5136352.1 HAMP domain-containing histidine kinase [Clostridiaceae bacterium UIB06]